MRKLISIIFLAALAISCQTFTNIDVEENDKEIKEPSPVEDNDTGIDESISINFPDWDDRDALASGLIASEKYRLDEMPNATIYHLDLNIGDDPKYITGSEEVRYFNQEDIALDEIYFHLMPNYLGESITISEVKIDGETVEYKLEMEDTLMRVPFASPLPMGESVIIEVDFVTVVPTQLEKNYGILAYTNGVLALAHAYPMISVHDDEGWNIATPAAQGDVTYLDASFYLVRVSAPKELVIVTSGNEIRHKSTSDRQIGLYAAAPARDFYLAASPDYVRIQKDFGDYVINSYAPEISTEGAELALDVATAAIAFFSEQYAPYPYTEFDIASTPTFALGIEYPGMTAINIDLYDLSAELYGAPASVYLESTVAHEVGHQWFYNFVGNDQLDEPWLDESLAQYITWQYYLDEHGENSGASFEQALQQRWKRVDEEKIALGMPVMDYENGEYGAIIYGRGAFFFEALEEKMGAETFEAFMKDYTQSQFWGIATTESMRQIAEKHCACDLEVLYTEWVY